MITILARILVNALHDKPERNIKNGESEAVLESPKERFSIKKTTRNDYVNIHVYDEKKMITAIEWCDYKQAPRIISALLFYNG